MFYSGMRKQIDSYSSAWMDRGCRKRVRHIQVGRRKDVIVKRTVKCHHKNANVQEATTLVDEAQLEVEPVAEARNKINTQDTSPKPTPPNMTPAAAAETVKKLLRCLLALIVNCCRRQPATLLDVICFSHFGSPFGSSEDHLLPCSRLAGQDCPALVFGWDRASPLVSRFGSSAPDSC